MPDYRITARLLATPAVTALVVDRVFPGIEESQDFPAIAVELGPDEPHADLEVTRGGGTASVHLEAWGRSYAEAKQVAAAVRTALVGEAWWTEAGTPPLSSVRLESSSYGGREELPGRAGWYHWFELTLALQYGDS